MSRKQARQQMLTKVKDLGALGFFVGAIAMLVVIGFYVASRLATERAHQEKWKDYVDCGWA